MNSELKRAGLGQRDYIALAPYQLRPHRSPRRSGGLKLVRVANGAVGTFTMTNRAKRLFTCAGLNLMGDGRVDDR
jgi:hypothetical protein